jgi:hypothetical protein
MKARSTVIGIAILATFAAAPAAAQTTSASTLTHDQLGVMAQQVGSDLRFRQLGDTTTLPRGRADLGVQFASASGNQPAANGTRFVGRFGMSQRVDLGVWAGYNSEVKDGMAGIDVKIALCRQGPSRPVSVSVRPSFSSLLGASDVWVGTTGVDLTVSRAYGAFAPYAGVGATSALAIQRLRDIDVERDTAGHALTYAGFSYRWRSLIAAAEVEKGAKASFGFRLGTRF